MIIPGRELDGMLLPEESKEEFFGFLRKQKLRERLMCTVIRDYSQIKVMSQQRRETYMETYSLVGYHYFLGQFFLGEIFFYPHWLPHSIGQGSTLQGTNFAAVPASAYVCGH